MSPGLVFSQLWAVGGQWKRNYWLLMISELKWSNLISLLLSLSYITMSFEHNLFSVCVCRCLFVCQCLCLRGKRWLSKSLKAFPEARLSWEKLHERNVQTEHESAKPGADVSLPCNISVPSASRRWDADGTAPCSLVFALGHPQPFCSADSCCCPPPGNTRVVDSTREIQTETGGRWQEWSRPAVSDMWKKMFPQLEWTNFKMN